MKLFFIFAPSIGGLAQLARAFDWQSKGHRFDSDILHSEYQRVTINLWLFFYLVQTTSRFICFF